MPDNKGLSQLGPKGRAIEHSPDCLPRAGRSNEAPSNILGNADEFTPRADLTYRTFDGISISTRSVRQSLLTGTLLRSCRFSGVGFQRCDLDGVRIEGCEFVGCNFQNIDFRSCLVTGSKFVNCSFADALIDDSSFAEVVLDHVSFRGAAIAECSFASCALLTCDLTRSSFVQSRFDLSRVEQMTLGDCTFLYNIMKRCRFHKVRINAESMGMIFGLSEDDVAGMGLMYLGKDQQLKLSRETLPTLAETYRLRRWHFGVALMRINFNISSTAYALAEYLATLRSAVIVKRDELQFFARVIEELASDRKLPLASCISAIETISALAQRTSAAPDAAKQEELFRALLGRLTITLGRMLDLLEEKRLSVRDFASDRRLNCEFRLAQKPGISMAAIINEVAAASGLPILGPSDTLETRTGSFVEVVRTTLLSVAALQVFLYLLNGCIVQVTELRGRLGVLSRRRQPEAYRALALQPKQSLPPALVGPLRSLTSHALGVGWLDDAKLRGFGSDNAIEGTILSKADGVARGSKTQRRSQRAPRR